MQHPEGGMWHYPELLQAGRDKLTRTLCNHGHVDTGHDWTAYFKQDRMIHLILVVPNTREGVEILIAARVLQLSCVLVPVDKRELLPSLCDQLSRCGSSESREKKHLVYIVHCDCLETNMMMTPEPTTNCCLETVEITTTTIGRAHGLVRPLTVGLLTSGSTGESSICFYEWTALDLQANVTLETLLQNTSSSRCVTLFVTTSIVHAYAINAIMCWSLIYEQQQQQQQQQHGPACAQLILLNPEQLERDLVTFVKPLLNDDDHKKSHELRRHSKWICYGTPRWYQQFLDQEEKVHQNNVTDEDLWWRFIQRLDVPFSAGSRIPPQLYRGFISRFGKPLWQNYGSTECSQIAFQHLPEEEESRQTSVGRVWPGVDLDISIHDDDSNHGGEINVSTPWQSYGKMMIHDGLVIHNKCRIAMKDVGWIEPMTRCVHVLRRLYPDIEKHVFREEEEEDGPTTVYQIQDPGGIESQLVRVFPHLFHQVLLPMQPPSGPLLILVVLHPHVKSEEEEFEQLRGVHWKALQRRMGMSEEGGIHYHDRHENVDTSSSVVDLVCTFQDIPALHYSPAGKVMRSVQSYHDILCSRRRNEMSK